MGTVYRFSYFSIQIIKQSKYEMSRTALAGVAQWIECQPVNLKVTGSSPGQGTYLGCGPGPQLGACERLPINVSLKQDVSLPLFLPPFFSL